MQPGARLLLDAGLVTEALSGFVLRVVLALLTRPALGANICLFPPPNPEKVSFV